MKDEFDFPPDDFGGDGRAWGWVLLITLVAIVFACAYIIRRLKGA